LFGAAEDPNVRPNRLPSIIISIRFSGLRPWERVGQVRRLVGCQPLNQVPIVIIIIIRVIAHVYCVAWQCGVEVRVLCIAYGRYNKLQNGGKLSVLVGQLSVP